MAVTLLPCASIRPLGEEHLRMFRRTVRSAGEETERVVLPPETKTIVKVFLSKEGSLPSEVFKAAEAVGVRVASITDLCMDEGLVKRKQGYLIYISWEGVPPNAGYYHVDRRRHKLVKISDEQYGALKWHEKLLVATSASDAIKRRVPLAFNFDVNAHGGTLVVYGDYDENHTARVAYVQEK